MSISTRVFGDTLTISIGDKFNFDVVEEFREAYVENEASKYVVDFRNAVYMDSSGLGMLLNMRRAVNANTADITLINCRDQVKKVLLISKFEMKFTIK